jgi:hypothetical protein
MGDAIGLAELVVIFWMIGIPCIPCGGIAVAGSGAAEGVAPTMGSATRTDTDGIADTGAVTPETSITYILHK